MVIKSEPSFFLQKSAVKMKYNCSDILHGTMRVWYLNFIFSSENKNENTLILWKSHWVMTMSHRTTFFLRSQLYQWLSSGIRDLQFFYNLYHVFRKIILQHHDIILWQQNFSIQFVRTYFFILVSWRWYIDARVSISLWIGIINCLVQRALCMIDNRYWIDIFNYDHQ